MARVDYQHVARTLSAEFQAKGYLCRLDENHKHPRLYMGCNDVERYALLSRTANYDEGDLLNMKRQDIVRDILPHLPTPPSPPIITPSPIISDHQNITVGELTMSSQVFPVKVFLIGRGGTFAVRVPEEAIPSEARLAQIVNFDDNNKAKSNGGGIRLGLVFSAEHGVKPSGTSKLSSVTYSKNILCYYFSRDKVPFKYARQQPSGFKVPLFCARRMGDSLVCDKPLPKELLEDSKPKDKLLTERTMIPPIKKGAKTEYSLEDGRSLREMINDWAAWARALGHEPKLTINDEGELRISVIAKITKEL